MVKVQSYVPSGSGAWILHDQLRVALPDYQLHRYSRWWEVFPPGMPLLRKGHADLIHATLDYGALFRSPGTPLVTTAHNFILDDGMRPYASPLQRLHYRTDLRWFTLLGLRYSDRVVAVSRFVANRLKQDLGYRGRIDVIYNGVDTERFTPGTERGSSPHFRVLFCGNTTRRKRAKLLVPLANALGSRFEIQYTAGLSRSSMLPGVLQPNSARLKSLGKVPHAQMVDLYRQVDLLFMPSAREGFGLCVAEAMACGLPVVAAGGSAMDELIAEQQGGFLCEVDDVTGFAEAIRGIADDHHLATQMGQFNRARVEQQFMLGNMVDAYRKLFVEVLDG